MTRSFVWILIFGCISFATKGQEYTRADTLRGSLSQVRRCYDVTYYDLNIRINHHDSSIQGYNNIHFKVIEDFDSLQVDLFENMAIDSITYLNKPLTYRREFGAVFISFLKTQEMDSSGVLSIYYHGNPISAKRAPWDGGFVWKKDQNGLPWVGVACEGTGASLWWPNKDHLSDEPDSMAINIEVDSSLVCIANGQLRGIDVIDRGYKRHKWFVSYPINNYNVTVNIGNYTHFHDVYISDGDSLDLDYYVLPYNLDKAREHFKQVKPMLKSYEKFFGKYPFWDDGYALVETHYWGMEHQGAIAYGNNYRNQHSVYPPQGFSFDYIIVHETGHEYWGNNVSCTDHAEMWIHESFCTYAEALYVEDQWGKKKAIQYLNASKNRIMNHAPMHAVLGVNASGDSDMYLKGSMMLHTLRSVINDDKLWFRTLKRINERLRHKNVSTMELINHMSDSLNRNVLMFFVQYLFNPQPPTLEFQIVKEKRKSTLRYRWNKETAKDLDLPIRVTVRKKKFGAISPSSQWQELRVKKVRPGSFKIDTDYYYVFAKEFKGEKGK